ncbi:sensor histidine kinase [Streptococcus danieliae]|uniref:sensor histidine kinase n=1 Tax=Streptococcus danieliae TaxID=747656 RepID=UPI001365661D|nr:sensor histidine kinase [Streptococcus danieliae]
MKKFWIFHYRKINPLFFVGLLFLYFPFYYAQYSSSPLLYIGMTLAFAVLYISLLYTDHPGYSCLAWFYLISYIFSGFFFANPLQTLFIFNLSNLISWHYKDESWNYRTISYAISIGVIFIWSILAPIAIEVKVASIILHLFGLALLFGNLAEMKKEKMEAKMRQQNESINLLLAENERNRISQDLHDTLGHVFAMMAIKAELAQTLIQQDLKDQALQEVRDLQQISKQSMADVRKLVEQVNTHTIHQELQILQQMLELAQIQLTIEGQELANSLSPHKQTLVSMILRELANNLIKHSQAQICNLLFTQNQKHICLTYQDNGIGFQKFTGTELHSVRKRLIPIKGDIHFVSLANPTQINIQIPLEED